MSHDGMSHFLSSTSAAFMPHGHCWLWTPGIFWMMILGNATVALAYYSIPFVLFKLLRGRRDLPYPHIFALFGLFILFCGTGHIVDIITIWHPIYWFDAFWDTGTGAISIATAIVLWPLLPKLLKAGTLEEFLQRQAIESLEEQKQALEEANVKLDETNRALKDQMAAMNQAAYALAERESRIQELREENERLKALVGTGG